MAVRDPDDPLLDFARRAADMNHTRTADAAAVEVIGALRERGTDALAVKGVALARWLYRSGEARGYVDCDLLVAPADLEPAAQALAALGFSRIADQSAAPETWTEAHAQTWWRTGGAHLDLHWRLPGLGIDPADAWAVLWESREALAVDGAEIAVLGTAARCLHVATHAAQHAGQGRPLSDLSRALERLDDADWLAARALAARLDAIDAMSAGLRLDPRGAALAERLGLPETSVRWRLVAGGAEAFGAERLLRWTETRGARERLRLAFHAVFPPRGQMAMFYPQARSAHARAAARLRHALRTPARAARAWWAIRNAR